MQVIKDKNEIQMYVIYPNIYSINMYLLNEIQVIKDTNGDIIEINIYIML